MALGERMIAQTLDLTAPSRDVVLGLAALRAMLKGHRLRSVQLLADHSDWVRLTFDDDTELDLPAVCLTMSVSAEAPRMPGQRRVSAR